MLTHTLRFCFFNAEEQGLLGSAAYANHLKSTGAPVKAVMVVDMAGYDIVGAHQFEIHAGTTDPAARITRRSTNKGGLGSWSQRTTS